MKVILSTAFVIFAATLASSQPPIIDPPQPPPTLSYWEIRHENATTFSRATSPTALYVVRATNIFDDFTNEARVDEFDITVSRLLFGDPGVCGFKTSDIPCWESLNADPTFESVSIVSTINLRRQPNEIFGTVNFPLDEFNQPSGLNAWLVEATVAFEGQSNTSNLGYVVTPEPAGVLSALLAVLGIIGRVRL